MNHQIGIFLEIRYFKLIYSIYQPTIKIGQNKDAFLLIKTKSL